VKLFLAKEEAIVKMIQTECESYQKDIEVFVEFKTALLDEFEQLLQEEKKQMQESSEGQQKQGGSTIRIVVTPNIIAAAESNSFVSGKKNKSSSRRRDVKGKAKEEKKTVRTVKQAK